MALRFECGDLLLVTSGEFVMRCAYRRMHGGLLGRLLLGQSLLIVSKILFHPRPPNAKRAARSRDSRADLST
jgi:hypothetical protein